MKFYGGSIVRRFTIIIIYSIYTRVLPLYKGVTHNPA